MFAAPLAIRSLPFANRRAIRRAIRCRFSMSPDAFHSMKASWEIEKRQRIANGAESVNIE